MTSSSPGLDVADVGGADQIERAGLGADDVGAVQLPERERTEAVRIARGDQPILRHHRQRKGAGDLRDGLDQRVLDRVLSRARVQVQHHLGVAAGLEDRPVADQPIAQLFAR